MTDNHRGVLFALAAFAIFSAHDVVIKILGTVYAPIQIVFFSVLLSFPLATLMLMRDSTPGTLLPKHPWWVAFRTAATVVTAFCAFYAFSVLPLAQTYAILFAAPLLITILSIPILGEKVRLRRWFAVGAGLIGVLVVLRPGQADLSLGHLAALVAAIGSSFTSIITRKVGNEERSVVLLLYPMIANFTVMGLALPFVYKPMPAEHFGLLAVIAVCAWAATRCVIAAYQKGDAVIIAPMQYSQIIWATLYGALFFNERPDLNTAIGAGIIIASGLYIVFRESRPDASENTPVLRTRSRAGTPSAFRVSAVMRARRRASARLAKSENDKKPE